MTRAELFWLAYLWLCNDYALEQARQFRDAWDAALEQYGREMTALLFGDTDFRQRTLYAVDIDPGDISWSGRGFAHDRGGAKAWEDWE